ncbi:MAG TPA: phosphatase PAP2 family protein [Acetobacteraceae bacterium]|nr:phosphatase PAP2 family protein [Acetobacteraceae bacterium]
MTGPRLPAEPLDSAEHLSVALAAAAILSLLLRTLIWAGLRIRLRPSRPGPELPALAAVGMAVLFGGLTWAVLMAGGVTDFDAAVSVYLALYRVPWLLHGFLWLTTLGTSAALAGVAATATGFLWVHHRSGLILPLWVTFTGAQTTVWIAKYAIGRARPVFLEGLATALSPSFPSAHATGAAATFGFVAYAVARDLGPRQRREIAYWTAVLIALIGFSRVILGVHFATDVAGGFLLGGIWLLIGIALARWARLTNRAAVPHR